MTGEKHTKQMQPAPEDWFQQLYSGAWRETESLQDIEASVCGVKEEIMSALYLAKMTDLDFQILLGNQDVMIDGADRAFADLNRVLERWERRRPR